MSDTAPPRKKRVLVTDSLQDVGVEFLRSEGLEVDVTPALSPDELARRIAPYAGLVVRSATKVTGEVLEAARELEVIGRAGVGLDNVDVEAATRRGIVCMNTPGGNTIAAAEHTMALLLAMTRKLPQAHAHLKGGKWERERFLGAEVYGKTLGIVGLGRIGAEVARRAQGFAMTVIAYDPYLTEEVAQRLGVELVDLDTLYRRADFITLHVPLTKETRGLIGSAELAKMKDGVRIVDCARGGIVDEAALAAAVQAGKVAAAALDVFEQEPPWGSPLLDLDAVVVTPHLGASTEEAQTSVAVAIAQQVADLLLRGIVRNAVNAPSVDPEVLRELAPYLTLAAKLGSFLGQVAQGRMTEARLHYAGEVAAQSLQPLTVTFLRGLLAVILEENVTDVNAPYLARQRGLRVVESKTPVSEDFASLLAAELRTDRGTWQVAGTLFHRKDPRIVQVDGYRLEAHPSGWMVVFTNDDVPGVIGRIGTLFGTRGINIAGMQLGRERPGGRAVSILNLDGAVPDHVLAELRALPNIRSATLVRL
ncbi:MAG: phosphoglycerate dehydrogenase [Candidatus Rokubacteria bacterium]|nr:phosphoglycerate dehydrogenase [Candidatus Rokubacteria bacterium]